MIALKSSIGTTMRLGFKSLMLHKLRSALTMLGIIFGVCSVIAMLAIGEGASSEAQDAIKKLGRDNIILRSVKPPDEAKQAATGRASSVEYGLTYKDASRIQGTVPGVLRVLPIRIIRETVRFAERASQCQVLGTLPSYTDIVNLDLVRGRFITETDERNQNNVCVISVSLAQRLFPYQDPLNESVKIDGFYYRVVGLAREKDSAEQRPQSGQMEGEPLESNIYMCLSTVRSRFGETIWRVTSTCAFPPCAVDSAHPLRVVRRAGLKSRRFNSTRSP
jgi:putative ABC transport system permease protein